MTISNEACTASMCMMHVLSLRKMYKPDDNPASPLEVQLVHITGNLIFLCVSFLQPVFRFLYYLYNWMLVQVYELDVLKYLFGSIRFIASSCLC